MNIPLHIKGQGYTPAEATVVIKHRQAMFRAANGKRAIITFHKGQWRA